MKRVFVHRFRWAHDRRRQQMKQLLKEGTARLVATTHDGKLYEVPDEVKVKR